MKLNFQQKLKIFQSVNNISIITELKKSSYGIYFLFVGKHGLILIEKMRLEI